MDDSLKISEELSLLVEQEAFLSSQKTLYRTLYRKAYTDGALFDRLEQNCSMNDSFASADRWASDRVPANSQI